MFQSKHGRLFVIMVVVERKRDGGHGMLSLSVSANEGKVGQKKYLISSGGRG